MYIPGNPSVPYNHPTHYEPLWRTATNSITLCFHRNHGGPPDKTDWDRVVEDRVSIGGIVTRYFSAVRPFSYLIFAGVFDRYPDLKIVGAEVDCGWVPFWVQTLVHHWDIQKSWFPVKLQHDPAEFIGKNLFTTNVDDYVGYDLIKTGLFPYLSSMTMFSSDYPHSATIWPNSRAGRRKNESRNEAGGCTQSVQRKRGARIWFRNLGKPSSCVTCEAFGSRISKRTRRQPSNGVTMTSTRRATALPPLEWGAKAIMLCGGLMVALALSAINSVLPQIEADLAHGPQDSLLIKQLVGIVGLSMVIGAPLAGFLVDRIGARRVVITACLLYAAIGTAGLYLSSSAGADRISPAARHRGRRRLRRRAMTMINTRLTGIDRAKWMGAHVGVAMIGSIIVQSHRRSTWANSAGAGRSRSTRSAFRSPAGASDSIGSVVQRARARCHASRDRAADMVPRSLRRARRPHRQHHLLADGVSPFPDEGDGDHESDDHFAGTDGRCCVRCQVSRCCTADRKTLFLRSTRRLHSVLPAPAPACSWSRLPRASWAS